MKMAVSITGIVIAVFVIILAVVAVLFLFYRFYFLRKPERKVPGGRVIVSPASGKVVRILDIGKEGYKTVEKGLLGRVKLLTKDVGDAGYLIVIMMTPFDVHFQRAPADGRVEKVSHRKGKFLNAVKDAESMQALENENNSILMSCPGIGRIKVVQVAGFLARRIRCFVCPKQKIHKGEEIGLICLGSQVILVTPKLKIRVKEGQRVVDGETIIAGF
ncbi:phosphatidylserine decarboxylase [Candidatus Woesearchaeota archaeon]|nr:phosphatidylserine decarboxylase [Candidatus Woesearchaeota archaeon]